MEKAMVIYNHEIGKARLQGFFAGVVVGVVAVLAMCV